MPEQRSPGQWLDHALTVLRDNHCNGLTFEAMIRAMAGQSKSQLSITAKMNGHRSAEYMDMRDLETMAMMTDDTAPILVMLSQAVDDVVIKATGTDEEKAAAVQRKLKEREDREAGVEDFKSKICDIVEKGTINEMVMMLTKMNSQPRETAAAIVQSLPIETQGMIKTLAKQMGVEVEYLKTQTEKGTA